MATTVIHDNQPTPPPPKTYDILGLTEDQMKLIVQLVGSTPQYQIDKAGLKADSFDLWRALPSEQLFDDDNSFTIAARSNR